MIKLLLLLSLLMSSCVPIGNNGSRVDSNFHPGYKPQQTVPTAPASGDGVTAISSGAEVRMRGTSVSASTRITPVSGSKATGSSTAIQTNF